MCYKTIETLKCEFCDSVAVVYNICTDDYGKIRNCIDILAVDAKYNGITCEVVFVKSDGATDITFICGWCNVWIGHGVLEDNKRAPCSEDTIYEIKTNPVTVRDYLIKTIADKKPGEDAGACGYEDTNGNIVSTFCTYELYDEMYSTTIYYANTKRRRLH